MKIIPTAEYERVIAPVWNGYNRVCASTTRLLIPYPFGKN
jgi:hypothetical protein